ncbi:MAG: indolepyruvate ferredoxin oxidoreductase family protein [Bauldia sp.]
MSLEAVTLDDKYDLEKTRVLVTGTQAIIRLTLMQEARDRRDGHNTAGYVTGYRGSPLGGLDTQFWRAKHVLEPVHILFQTAINEDLAATALWGTQQAEMRGEGRFDGVFGIWYGKGPGVDRAGDALRHANLAGTSPLGGVIALMGDDHTCESSTTAHQSEFAFVDAQIPILNPAGVQEIIDYGLYGFALSRFAGTWAGLKCVKETVESTAVIDGSLDRVRTVVPADFVKPPGGLNIRPSDHPLRQEERLHEQKIPAVLAFLRTNPLDRMVLAGGRTPRIGIATAGKSYLDVLQALDELGVDEVRAADLGLRLLKIGCTWPLDPQSIGRFAEGLEKIVVVEEKRGLIEGQIKEILYGGKSMPAIVGKKDEAGVWLFPSKGALDTNEIAIAIGTRLMDGRTDAALEQRLAALREAEAVLRKTESVAERMPYFCPGCPHNTSTVVPEGSRAYAGIGCHYMAQFMDRHTEGYTQMGAEGANWVGEAPFSTRGHVFQNIGDGTYNHSGILAIRAAAAAKVNITYKILFNDAVAMTGGQPNDGGLTVPQIANQVAAEGARKVVIVSEEPEAYPAGTGWPEGTTVHHREDLDEVQADLARVGGLSVMIYDQTCAAEKRRRRKRGKLADPDKRVIINELVCEGCGDCGVQSNCVAVVPVETEFGRKRAIDQSNCNKDFSCLKGFCPSFVTVHGASLKKAQAAPLAADFVLPSPVLPQLDDAYAMLITGVGGTGVVTIGALLAMAAHLEGKGVAVIDMAGLAQKGGAVTTHLRLAARPEDIKAIRVPAAGADLVLACDMVVASSAKQLAAIAPGRTRVVVNTHETYPGDFTRDADFTLPTRRILAAFDSRAGASMTRTVEATRIATALLGDAIAANMFMLGFAWQTGAIPLGDASIARAIELNGVDIAMNKAAFAWGRRAAVEPQVVAGIAEARSGRKPVPIADTLEEIVARRVAFLTAYQNKAYAARYAKAVAAMEAAAKRTASGNNDLAATVARNLFKLMAIKDEYEVARLYTDGSFSAQLRSQFADWKSLEFHLAPPVLGRRDPATGHLRKQTFGPWMMTGFRLLAALKGLRGTALDIFGRTEERQMERRLLSEYEATLDLIATRLTAANHAFAVSLAAYPEKIRGYGHIRASNAVKAEVEARLRREAFLGGAAVAEAAE